ncbi:hypothetical protein [Nocardia carnea]|uniref:hypothetical protein n=1 Tax=Nocardia carnea TaxID=37328 RepID=UPI002458E3B7|nr:hypothetical protein [Nocardia carnea]
MTVGRDSQGRDLKVGDPVTVWDEVVKGGRGYGRRSHGTVASFGSVNVQVRIEDSDWRELIGTTVPVKGSSLTYGHNGHVHLADQIAETNREYSAAIEQGKQDYAEDVLLAVIEVATQREFITQEQGRELLSLRDDISQVACTLTRGRSLVSKTIPCCD